MKRVGIIFFFFQDSCNLPQLFEGIKIWTHWTQAAIFNPRTMLTFALFLVLGKVVSE